MRKFQLFASCSFLLLVLGCGDDKGEVHNRTKRPSEDTFSLASTSEAGWVRVLAYGHSFLYPSFKDDVKEMPAPQQRWPLTISPSITGSSHQGERVDMVMTIDGQRDMQACVKAENDRTYQAIELSNNEVKWAGVKVESKKHDNGLYIPYVHVFYRGPKHCTKVFFYDATLDGTLTPLSWDDATELMKKLHKVVESYRREIL